MTVQPVSAATRSGRSSAGYSTRDVSELIGLTHHQIRQYVRQGLVLPLRGPRRHFRFTFRDVVVLRTAKGLLDSKVSSRKTHRVLRKLKEQLQSTDALTALKFDAAGADVVVRNHSASWVAETGQGCLDFSVVESSLSATSNVTRIDFRTGETLADRSVRASQEMSSDDWYNLALELEEVSPREAPDAYEKALALNPENADAWVNLGRLYQLAGKSGEAEAHYRKATTLAPEHELALYNLGTIHDERDEWDTAIELYHQATGVADAHYNLARLYELRGNELAAIRHIRRYHELIY